MDVRNNCRFIDKERNREDVYIVHFVHETKEQRFDGWKSLSFYRMGYVAEGEGVYRTQYGEYRLKKGDVFFGIPGTLYALQSIRDFQYYYIGYLGTRPLKLMDRLKINARNCVFHGCESLDPLFKEGISFSDEILAMGAESILLYGFSVFGNKYLAEENKGKEGRFAETVRKYVDDNFTDPELSLEKIGKVFSYNPKYISSVFKKQYGVSFKNYINDLRVQNACALLEKGFIGVQNVAFLSGFNDPLYFSKVFKQRMGATPSKMSLLLEEQKKNNQTLEKSD